MKRHFTLFSLLSLLALLSLACNLGGLAGRPPTAAPPTVAPTATPRQAAGPTQPSPVKRCGDGLCDGPENPRNCPQDCPPPTQAAPPTAEAQPSPTAGAPLSAEPGPEPDSYRVTNPTGGARLYVQVVHPQDWDGGPLPALVLVPGGSGDSSGFLKPPSEAQRLADAGLVIVVFDPDGRGRSEGVEDDDGYTHQDGLAAVLRFAATLPEVDAARIGLVSYSYGVTMASGALARHPDLPVQFLMDWEGPANRDDTGGCDEAHTGHLKDHSCNDEDFWREREAATFALQLPVPYQRLQSERDHVQPDDDHALLMIANATATEYGGHGIAPWTRLNDLTPNTVYSTADPPPMLSEQESKRLEPLIVHYALELFDLFAAPASSEATPPPPTVAASAVVIPIGGVNEADPVVKPLLGVVSGPDQPLDSPAPNLTDRFHDIGVLTVRNNDYFDDRMDMEGIFNCGGPTYPSWEGCDPQDEANYHWEASDALFASWLAGGFEPFLRLGGEVQNANPHHDFKGPQNPTQEANWVQAAQKVVDRYLHWDGQAQTFTYLDIWTEFPNKSFWDRSNMAFFRFWTQAFVTLEAAYPELKIGGPGFVASQAIEVVAGEKSTAQDFLAYLYENKVKPDWIGWHLFYNDPAMWHRAAQAYRDLLDGKGMYADVPWAGSGFFDGVELIVDAYGVAKMNLSPEERDQIYNHGRGAAIRTAAWIAMQYGDVERAYLYRAGDPRSSPDDSPEAVYRGNYSGLFYGDAQATYKPSAHAFRLWSQVVNRFPTLLTTPLPPTGATGGLWVLAARNERGPIAVLLSNVTADDVAWTLALDGVTMEDYRVEIYQVDDADDGRTAHPWSGGAATIPAESVQLVILTPN